MENRIKINSTEMVCQSVDWVPLAQNSTSACFVSTVTGFVNTNNFLLHLSSNTVHQHLGN